MCSCNNPLYFGDTCDEKHNIAWNVALACIILIVALCAIPVIILRGRVADVSINLKEWLLRNALQDTRATKRVEYPKGVKRDDALVFVRDHCMQSDGKLVREDGAIALCRTDDPGLEDVDREQVHELRALRPEYTEASFGHFALCAPKRFVISLEQNDEGLPKELAVEPGDDGAPIARTRLPQEKPANALPGWPLSQYQPRLDQVWLDGSNPERVDALAEKARREKISNCLKLLPMLPFLMLVALVRDLTWFCLILRSIEDYFDVPDRFKQLFDELQQALITLGAHFVVPVLNLLRLLFSWLYVTLNLSNLMQWLFQLEIAPDAEITCKGTQQPMYLFADIVIAVCIISLASADVLGPFRFRQRWAELVTSRGKFLPSPISLLGEKVENFFVYVLRALILLVSRRPFQLGKHTSYCGDQPITAITFIAALFSFPILALIMLSSFVPSVGPAPPQGTDANGAPPSAEGTSLATVPGTSGTIELAIEFDDEDEEPDAADGASVPSPPVASPPVAMESDDGQANVAADDTKIAAAGAGCAAASRFMGKCRAWLLEGPDHAVWEEAPPIGMEAQPGARVDRYIAEQLERDWVERRGMAPSEHDEVLQLEFDDGAESAQGQFSEFNRRTNVLLNKESGEQRTLRRREQEYWKEVEPLCADLERCRAHHRVFSRTGVLRRGWRAGGIGYIARTILWKWLQVFKITVALWDEHSLLAARVMPRASALLPSASLVMSGQYRAGYSRPVAVGLQCYQDMMGVSGRFIATMWCIFPCGAAISLISEAMNRSPIYVYEHAFVSDTAVARWRPKYTNWWRSGGFVARNPNSPYPGRNDRAFIVMNDSRRGRLVDFVFETVQAVSVLVFSLAPNAATSMLYLLIMLVYESRSYILGGAFTRLYDRRCEWRRRADAFEQLEETTEQEQMPQMAIRKEPPPDTTPIQLPVDCSLDVNLRDGENGGILISAVNPWSPMLGILSVNDRIVAMDLPTVKQLVDCDEMDQELVCDLIDSSKNQGGRVLHVISAPPPQLPPNTTPIQLPAHCVLGVKFRDWRSLHGVDGAPFISAVNVQSPMLGILSVGDQVVAIDLPDPVRRLDLPARLACEEMHMDMVAQVLNATKNKPGRVMHVIKAPPVPPPPNTTPIELPVGCSLGISISEGASVFMPSELLGNQSDGKSLFISAVKPQSPMLGILSVGDQVVAVDLPERVDCAGVHHERIETMLNNGYDQPERVMYIIRAPSAASAPAPSTIRVAVPEGAGPGTTVQAQAPDGRTVQAVVPPGLAPGSLFHVQLPPLEPTMQQPMMMRQPIVTHASAQFCTLCGAKFGSDARFCETCGSGRTDVFREV